jgi:hypothetical protein
MSILNCLSRGTDRSRGSGSSCMSFVIKKLRVAEEDALKAALWYDELDAVKVYIVDEGKKRQGK